MADHKDDAEELERWARDFIDYWQDQASALAGDPAVLAFWAKPLAPPSAEPTSLASAQDQPALFPTPLPGPPSGPPSGPPTGLAPDMRDDFARQWALAMAAALGHGGKQTDAPGTAPTASPPALRGDDLERLTRRLDALEERLAALGAEPAGAGRKSDGKSDDARD